MNRRRINIRGENLTEIKDRHAQLKARLLRSLSHDIASQKFEDTSYTDATMMLVETDITIQYRRMGQQKLFKSDENYYEILWTYFSARFIDPDWIVKLKNPSELFATMLSAVSELGDVPTSELYGILMNKDAMSYCGVKGLFQRVRVPGEGRYQKCLKLDEVSSIEHLYEASIRLCCVAIDQYVHNYLSDWSDLDYGAPYSCMNNYLERHGITEVFTLGGDESDLYPRATSRHVAEEFINTTELRESSREWMESPCTHPQTSGFEPSIRAAQETTFSDTPPDGPATIDHNIAAVNPNRLLP